MPDRKNLIGSWKPPSLTRIAAEIAGARFELALLRVFGELKYREDQSRLPKGQTGGGRFADEGRGTSHRAGVSPAGSRP